jgi:hypothetical protein
MGDKKLSPAEALARQFVGDGTSSPDTDALLELLARKLTELEENQGMPTYKMTPFESTELVKAVVEATNLFEYEETEAKKADKPETARHDDFNSPFTLVLRLMRMHLVSPNQKMAEAPSVAILRMLQATRLFDFCLRIALIFDSKGFEKNDPEDKVGKPFIDWPKYGPKWNQGFPDYSTAGSCGPTSDEDVNLKGYPTQPVVDLFNRGFALHWGVEPRDVWDLVVYALDYISLKQKAKKDGLYMTYSKKDLIVMDLFAMLKIRVHSDEEYDAGNYDGVTALKCTPNAPKDVLQQKAAHVETLYTKWTTLKQTCAAKYVVKGRLALKEVQDSLPAIGSDGVVDAGGGKKTKGTFKDNFASDLVYEHCLKVQLDYIRVLDGGVNKLGEGDCATNDGTYSCDPAGTFGQLLA